MTVKAQCDQCGKLDDYSLGSGYPIGWLAAKEWGKSEGNQTPTFCSMLCLAEWSQEQEAAIPSETTGKP